MAETWGPFDDTDLTEADWELMLQDIVDGVIGTPGGSSLRATPSGTTARGVDLAAGTALACGHWYKSSTVKTLTSSANSTGVARIDRAVLRVDRSANTVTSVLLPGTAGGGIPALIDTATVTDRPLWRWTIASDATTISGLVDERQWLGSTIRPSASATRPLSPRIGEITYDYDAARWVGWTGNLWRPVAPELVETEAPLSLASKWPRTGATAANRVRRFGRVVEVELNVMRAQDPFHGTADSGSPVATVPAGFRPSVTKYLPAVHITPNNYARPRIESDGILWVDNPTHRVDVGRVLRATLTYLL